jgi:hypothetical protein
VVTAGAASGVPFDARRQRFEQLAEVALAVAGRAHHRVGDHGRLAVLLHVPQLQLDPPGPGGRRGDLDAGGQRHVRPAAADGALVELVVDRADGVRADRLVQLPLRGHQAVAGRLVEVVKKARVVGRELFEAQLGVLHGRERGVRVSQRSPPRGRACNRSRNTSAPDCPEPMIVTSPAATSRARALR